MRSLRNRLAEGGDDISQIVEEESNTESQVSKNRRQLPKKEQSQYEKIVSTVMDFSKGQEKGSNENQKC